MHVSAPDKVSLKGIVNGLENKEVSTEVSASHLAAYQVSLEKIERSNGEETYCSQEDLAPVDP